LSLLASSSSTVPCSIAQLPPVELLGNCHLSSGLQLSASRRVPGEAKLGKDHWAALCRVQVTVTQEFHWG